MFKCEQCGKVAKSGQKSHRKVVETREKVYQLGAGRISTGSEIVKEIKVCEDCR